MQDIININQPAFIADHNIINGFMIANELVSDLKKTKSNRSNFQDWFP